MADRAGAIERAELLLENPCCAQRWIAAEHVRQPLLLRRMQTLHAALQQPGDVAPLSALAMYFVQRTRGQRNHVKLVGDDRGMRQRRLHGLPVRFREVDAHGPDRVAFSVQLQHRLGVALALSRHDRHRAACLQIPESRPHRAWPPYTEPVEPEIHVRRRRRLDHAMRLEPAALHQPLAHPMPTRHRPHRRLLCLHGYPPAQPARRAPTAAAHRVVLREHFATGTATEPPLPEQHVDRLLPEIGVLLALLPPLMHLARRSTAVWARRFVGFIPHGDVDRPRVFPHLEHDDARELQPYRDSLCLHLVSFPLLTFSSAEGYGNTRCFLSSLPLCIHTEERRTSTLFRLTNPNLDSYTVGA